MLVLHFHLLDSRRSIYAASVLAITRYFPMGNFIENVGTYVRVTFFYNLLPLTHRFHVLINFIAKWRMAEKDEIGEFCEYFISNV